ncbi:UDP-Glycosyltransferase superfamily protein isoform X2 [Carex rostrata]
MLNLGMETKPPSPPHLMVPTTSSSSGTAEKAFSFLEKGWREVKDSADADIRLMRARARSFKHLANQELENFLHSASAFSSPAVPPPFVESRAIAEIEFVQKLRPKLSEIRRVYSSPDFGQKVLEKWRPKPIVTMDLSAIRNAIVAEGEELVRWEEKYEEFWEPLKKLKTGLMEFEKKSTKSNDIFENFKSGELMEKVKLILGVKEPHETKEVQPLDFPELLASLIKQSEPFLDQIGIRKDFCEKIVDSLCHKHKGQALSSPDQNPIHQAEPTTDSLDLRIASVLQSTGYHYGDYGFWYEKPDDSSEIKEKRHVAIVTTASLPWMTGTAVNPLFRAAYLSRSTNQEVTLVVPWLCKSDQELVYPNNMTFSSPEEQEAYMRNWVEERVGFSTDFKISFYPGKFAKERRSIIPAGDTSKFIPSKEADIAILEEPEHLNWYHHGNRWTDKFNHVVGVVHTNYLEYIKREKFGALQAFLVKHINNIVARAYCDKVLRLSAATQDMPKSTVCNVHGVNPKFLEVGERIAAERAMGEPAFSKGAYFLGKMVWAKGYKELIDLMAKHKNDLEGFNLDVYGTGQDSHEVKTTASRLKLNLNFLNGRDHADDSLHGYKLFINPSVSDVLCTATAEALAMGKFVICADHPSNDFFRTFPNCLTYRTSEEFVTCIKSAMSKEPHPLTREQRYRLSWEAATERFMQFSELDKVLTDKNNNNRKRMGKSASMPNLSEMVDGGMAFAHYCLTGNEFLRLATGAIPGTRDYDKQHSRDLHLLPPQVQKPVYGW